MPQLIRPTTEISGAGNHLVKTEKKAIPHPPDYFCHSVSNLLLLC